jgi:hypothetical protein
VIVLNMVVVNLGLAALLPRDSYGRYSAIVAGALVVVQVTDGGLNLVAASRGVAVTPHLLLKVKLVSAMGGLAVIGAVSTASAAPGEVFLVTAFYAVAWPFYSAAEVVALSRGSHGHVLGYRVALALLVWSLVLPAAVLDVPAVGLVAIQAAAHFAVAAAGFVLDRRSPDSPASARPVKTPSARHWLLAAVMLGLPINLLSNGLLLVADRLALDSEVAVARLTLLVVLGLMMLAPLSAVQVATLSVTHGRPRVRRMIERSAAVALLMAAGGTALFSALPYIVPRSVFSEAASSCLAGALCAPAIQLGVLAVALRSVVSLRRAASAAAAAGLLCLTVYVTTPGHDLGAALAVLGLSLMLGAYGRELPKVGWVAAAAATSALVFM